MLSLQPASLLLSMGVCSAGAWNGNGPDGGASFAVDSRGGVLRMGTWDGVYQSVDGGAHWARLGDLARGILVGAVATSPADSMIVLASADQLYRSVDGGVHWTSTGQPPGRIAFHPLAPNQVLTTGSRSIDAGANWTPISLAASDVAADPGTAGVFYASTIGGDIYRSVDAGANWSLVANSSVGNLYSLAPDPFDDDVILSAASSLGVGYAVRFVRSGHSYSIAAVTEDSSIMLADPLASGRFWYVGTVVLPLDVPHILFESTDHGVSFSQVGPIRGSLLAADHVTTGLLYGSDALGFAVSSDAGRNWKSRTQGVPLAQTNTVSIRPDLASEILAGGEAYGVAISVDGGASWQPANSGLTQSRVNTLARSPMDPLVVYAGTGDGLFRSDDGGRHWSEIAITSYPNGTLRRLYDLAIDAHNPALMVAMQERVGKPIWSDDGGVNWRFAQTSDGAFDARLIIHAGRGTGKVYALGALTGGDFRLYRAAGHGEVFTPSSSAQLVSAVAVQPNNDNVLIAFARDGQSVHWNAYRSRDAGEHWQLRGTLALSRLGYEPRLAFDPCNPQTVHALDDGSSFTSHDQGMTWQEDPIAIPSPTFSQLDARCIGGAVVLAAATGQAGAQVRPGMLVDTIHVDGFETD